MSDYDDNPLTIAQQRDEECRMGIGHLTSDKPAGMRVKCSQCAAQPEARPEPDCGDVECDVCYPTGAREPAGTDADAPFQYLTPGQVAIIANSDLPLALKIVWAAQEGGETVERHAANQLESLRPLLLRLRAQGLKHNFNCAVWYQNPVCDCGKAKLEKEIDAVVGGTHVEEQQWIRVADKLPPDGALLGYKPTLDWDKVHITSGKAIRGDQYYTHWMPLPAPPADAVVEGGGR